METALEVHMMRSISRRAPGDSPRQPANTE
jgi:hypothetical protein